MKKDIEDELFPQRNKLHKDKDGAFVTTIVSVGLEEEIECTFDNDDCVVLNTDGYEYVTLTRENLSDLLNLIDEAAALYSPLNALGPLE